MGPYTLRYLPGVPLKERKHAPCEPMYATYGEAEDARERTVDPDLARGRQEVRAMTTCNVPRCDHPTRSPKSEICNAHYFRLRRTGTLGERPIRTPGRTICSVATCARPIDAEGMCQLHVRRFRKGGTPEFIGISPRSLIGPQNPEWKGSAVGYTSAHQRVYRLRGTARAYVCGCGAQAQQWSYDHSDPNELRAPKGWPYSADPRHYVPRCVSCHKRLDLRRIRRETGGRLGAERRAG